MAYYILEVDPELEGDTAQIKLYLQLFGADGSLNLLTKDVGGGVTHIMMELPNPDVKTGLEIVSGPLSRQQVSDYLVANSWL